MLCALPMLILRVHTPVRSRNPSEIAHRNRELHGRRQGAEQNNGVGKKGKLKLKRKTPAPMIGSASGPSLSTRSRSRARRAWNTIAARSVRGYGRPWMPAAHLPAPSRENDLIQTSVTPPAKVLPFLLFSFLLLNSSHHLLFHRLSSTLPSTDCLYLVNPCLPGLFFTLFTFLSPDLTTVRPRLYPRTRTLSLPAKTRQPIPQHTTHTHR